MLQKTKGIVLNYTRYGDSSIIAHIYTDNYGRQSFICSGIKGKKSKNKLVYFQPLSIVEMDVYAKQKNEIFRIKEIKYDHPLFNISGNIKKSTIALFLAEVLYKTLHESEPNSALFSFLNTSIQFLDNMDEGTSNFHLVFMIQLSKHLGIFPQADFDDITGVVTDKKIDNAERYFNAFPTKIKSSIAAIYKGSFQNIKNLQFNHSERLEILNLLIEFYQLHFNTIENIKSIEVFQELFKENLG